MARASAGRKWWNAVNTVRNPASCGGTSVALTGSASNRMPGIVGGEPAQGRRFGYLSVRQTGTSTPGRPEGREEVGPRAAAAGAQVGDLSRRSARRRGQAGDQPVVHPGRGGWR